ncbi:hypothetical protein D3C81_2042810 [compost metagenome]
MFIPLLILRAILQPEVTRQIDHLQAGLQQLRYQLPAHSRRRCRKDHIRPAGNLRRVHAIQLALHDSC